MGAGTGRPRHLPLPHNTLTQQEVAEVLGLRRQLRMQPGIRRRMEPYPRQVQSMPLLQRPKNRQERFRLRLGKCGSIGGNHGDPNLSAARLPEAVAVRPNDAIEIMAVGGGFDVVDLDFGDVRCALRHQERI